MGSKPSIGGGQVFNYLTVEGYDKKTKRYVCNCICGNKTLVSSFSLKSGKSKSCGCARAELVSKLVYKPNFEAAKNKVVDQYKRDAVRRNIEFCLTKSEVVELISRPCKYCGTENSNKVLPPKPYKIVSNEPFKYNGIDRVDNNLGYIPDNCVPCCRICNRAKNNLSEKEWLDWIDKLCKFNSKS
jgi:hypothetical protein